MNEILFLFFAFLTIFLSIKLSYYADCLNKTSLVSGSLIGLVLAGVTSLPEFVTCFSAVLVGNPSLALGDILGSNLFNIFMVCFFDLIFINRFIFNKIDKKHNLIIFLLLINYIFLFLEEFLNFSLFFIGIPSVVIVITYIFYIKSISKGKNVVLSDAGDGFLVIKLVITAVFMIMSSVILTIVVNNLSVLYPSFSSSFLGAIFLGVTTSLPEVITFYTLISIGNYNLAFLNILGSNLFNLFVLAVTDLIVIGFPIYNFFDNDSVFLIILGFLFVLLVLFNTRRKIHNHFSYIFFSFFVVFIYLCYWIFNFVAS